eukprot:s98_g15.t1
MQRLPVEKIATRRSPGERLFWEPPEKLKDGCDVERQALEQQLQKQLYSIFLEQRSIVEQVLYTRLKKDLLRRMRRKKRELSVKEKLKLLHAAMADYDDQVAELCPFFVANPERDRAERRLSELQWGIADTPEGKEMKQRWKMDRLRRAPTRQSRDPGALGYPFFDG